MASSGNANSSSLAERVAAALRAVVRPGADLVVGFSGGVDSVTLLDILAGLAPQMGYTLRALHVHHGISPNASDWVRFCEAFCARIGVALQIERVRLDSRDELGLEGAARRARYQAYAREDADFIVLAHHRDDQAETLLLQLLRGAGPFGMAGMPMLRPLPGSRSKILRPMLECSRADIQEWARARGLQWVDDESNADTSRARNFIRHRLLPAIEERYPAARTLLARTAAHFAEAADLLEELARCDLGAQAAVTAPVDIARLRRLGTARTKNILRALLHARNLPSPSAAQLDEFCRQLVEARADRSALLRVQGWEIRRYRGRVGIERAREPEAADFRQIWQGEARLPLLSLGGVLHFKPEEGRGLSVARLREGEVSVRLRAGGERLRSDPRRPRRTLKNLFQENGIPPWQRARWPLLYCAEHLVCVPGFGEDCSWRAAAGEPGLIVSWEELDGEVA